MQSDTYNLSQKLHDFIYKPGGIQNLLKLAFPIVISHAAQTIMMFTDRLFLSRVSKIHLSAAMSGGLTSFFTLTFFVGVIAYNNAFVAQYFGANRKKMCSESVFQTMIFALLSYPLVLLSVYPIKIFFESFNHHPQQIALEFSYYKILIAGSISFLFRIVFTTFFSGIGKTRIIMLSNVTGMLLNIPLNYCLIFGKFGFPKLGIEGAALGTIISSFCITLILGFSYFRKRYRVEYQILESLKFNKNQFLKLIKFGFPSGIELFLNIFAFNLFILLFHTYGPNQAAAITITFNWHLMSFIPMIGLNVGVMAIVGQHLGAKNYEHAGRAVNAGLVISIIYTFIMVFLYIFASDTLISFFTPKDQIEEYLSVIPLAKKMLMISSIFIIADNTILVISGALKGAGDSLWVMWSSIIVHWIMCSGEYALIKLFKVTPINSWYYFVVTIIILLVLLTSRLRKGEWKKIRLIEH